MSEPTGTEAETQTAQPGADRFAELDALSTETLRERAFHLATKRHDLHFFWDIIQLLPHADDAETVDGGSLGGIGAELSDLVSMWREFTGHGYGDSEPVLRSAFIDYLMKE
jgi:hypothetical protein